MSVSPILICIAGGTGSDKTSIAKSLLEEYGYGEVPVIELDAYIEIFHQIRFLYNFTPCTF